MRLIRLACMILVSVILTACGGGGTIEKPSQQQDSFTLSIQLQALNDGAAATSVSRDAPGRLVASLTKNGAAYPNQLVTFSLNGDIGVLDPSSGSAQTDANGEAVLTLRAGTVKGAGQVTATFNTPNGEAQTAVMTFTSQGDETDSNGQTGAFTLELRIEDENGLAFTSENPVSLDNMGTVTATLTQDGVALDNRLIKFTSGFTGKITPDLGTAQTNALGEAEVTLGPGNFKGAGTVTATFEANSEATVSQQAVFYSSGDGAPEESVAVQIDIKLLVGCNDDWDANRNNVKLDPEDPSTGCTVTNSIISNQLGEIYVDVTSTQSGDGIDAAFVEVQSSLGNVLPSSGTAITDAQGVALLKLQPGNEGGAGRITVTAKDISKESVFSVGQTGISLTVDNGLQQDTDGNDIALKAGGSTIIEVTLTDDAGNAFNTPTEVEFQSTCSASNQAIIDSPVTSSGGVATSTYRATGCKIDDVVSITVESGGQNFSAQTTIPVEEAPAQSLRFESVSNNFIALPPGEGGLPTQSIVKFALLDAEGQQVSQARIDFRLASTTGKASLTQATASTDNAGIVQTTVQAGVIPGPIVVQACYVPDSAYDESANEDATCWVEEFDRCDVTTPPADCPSGGLKLIPLAEQISSVSSSMTLTSGVTDQNSFDASPNELNLNALYYNGVSTDITVYFGDQFNQFNADGVAATLIAEAGAIGSIGGSENGGTFECITDDAFCTAQWRSQGDRPFYDVKWGNRIGEIDGNSATTEGVNPKTGQVNCDPYFGAAAPCINGLTRAKDDPNGVVMGGRVTILAYALGQENFVDKQSTDTQERQVGIFDIGEFYAPFDLDTAFIDYNENGVFDGVECGGTPDECAPANSNGGHDEIWFSSNGSGRYETPDGKYNGLLCSQEAENAGECNKELVHVRRSFEIVMSGDNPYVRFAVPRGTATCGAIANMNTEASDRDDFCDIDSIDVSSGNAGSVIYIFYTDEFGNPLPVGTEVTITASNGEVDVLNLSSPVANTTSDKPSVAAVYVGPETQGNQKLSGSLTINFKIPSGTEGGTGKEVSQSISVLDNQ